MGTPWDAGLEHHSLATNTSGWSGGGLKGVQFPVPLPISGHGKVLERGPHGGAAAAACKASRAQLVPHPMLLPVVHNLSMGCDPSVLCCLPKAFACWLSCSSAGGDTWRLTLQREEKADSIPLPMGMFAAV